MALKTVLLSVFATLVVAIPQHAQHLGNAQTARSNQVFGRSDLEDRTISYDGSCGSWSGYTCPDSTCCSAEGWCGAASAYCGTGCQVGFGQCDGSSDTSSSSSVAPTSATVEASASSYPEPITSTSTTASLWTVAYVPPSTTSTALAAATTTTSTAATTTTTAAATTTASSAGLGDTYTMYLGDGSTSEGWPAQSEWVDFDTAFENNIGLLEASCTQFGVTNNDADEISDFKSALQSVASSSGVDSRFLLAIAMQESGGCVRAPTTNYGVRNPGIFQSHDGTGTCNDSDDVQNPCPASEITQMVTDGATGTATGDGLEQTIAEAGTSDVSKYYMAARIYNSGSIAANGDLQDGIATHCYSSDVANRLTGWVHAASSCTLD